MAKMTIQALVEGGKATASPPLGPALGPTGLPIVQIIATINEKTKEFAGMQVPVKVIVDKDKKTFEIEIGTPPTSALIKKELGLTAPVKEEPGVKGKKPIGNLSMQQCVKIARMKGDAFLARSLKKAVKEVLGTCVSLGAQVEGKPAKQALQEVEEGKFDSLFG
jgi:large subunit ribosomal protein L11